MDWNRQLWFASYSPNEDIITWLGEEKKLEICPLMLSQTMMDHFG